MEASRRREQWRQFVQAAMGKRRQRRGDARVCVVTIRRAKKRRASEQTHAKNARVRLDAGGRAPSSESPGSAGCQVA